MPEHPESPSPDLDDLPGFGAAEIPPLVPDEDPDLEPASPLASEAPSTMSPSPNPSAPEGHGEPPTHTPSTRASTEPDPELTDGLEFLAGSLFELVGHFLNRMTRVRLRRQTPLWLVSEDEAERFAAPMARIADRHLPDELRSGDAKDVLIAGTVAVEYATHNAAGVPSEEFRPPGAEVHAPSPPPPPPAAAQPTPQQQAAEGVPVTELPPLVPADI